MRRRNREVLHSPACHLSYKLFWVGFILGEGKNYREEREDEIFSWRFLLFKKEFNMTLNNQYNKWKENTLKKSL